MQFASPRTGCVVVMSSSPESSRRAFHAEALSLMTPIHGDGWDAFVQPEGGLVVMGAVAEMVRTRRSPLSPTAMLTPVAIAETARAAHGTGRAVRLESAMLGGADLNTP